MRNAVRIMKTHSIAGSIINIGSSTALQLKNGRLHYTVTKSALHTLSRVVALDLAPLMIRVNVVSPGPTATEIVQKRIDDPTQSAMEEERLRKIPLGRYARTRDIANAVMFLSSEEASFITGAILPVDGGYTIGETV
jgi:NAD(P)-dependent dehydrogenase (short-subunit alcohol dehydrogenase family)